MTRNCKKKIGSFVSSNFLFVAKRSECNHYNITSQAEQEEEVEEEEVVIRSTRTRPKKGMPEGFVRNGMFIFHK